MEQFAWEKWQCSKLFSSLRRPYLCYGNRIWVKGRPRMAGISYPLEKGEPRAQCAFVYSGAAKEKEEENLLSFPRAKKGKATVVVHFRRKLNPLSERRRRRRRRRTRWQRERDSFRRKKKPPSPFSSSSSSLSISGNGSVDTLSIYYCDKSWVRKQTGHTPPPSEEGGGSLGNGYEKEHIVHLQRRRATVSHTEIENVSPFSRCVRASR